MTLFFAVGNPVFSMKLLFRSCSESEVEVADLTHGYRLLKKSLGIRFKNGKIFPWYVVPNPLLIRPKKVCDPANWHLGHLETAVEKIQGHIPRRCPALWHCTFVLFISLLRSCRGSCPLSPVCYSDLPSSGWLSKGSAKWNYTQKSLSSWVQNYPDSLYSFRTVWPIERVHWRPPLSEQLTSSWAFQLN